MSRIKIAGKDKTLGDRVSEMYKEIDKYGDVVFVVSQHRIRACRYVISGMSAKFRKTVYELHPNIEEIAISDWKNPIAFRCLVDFCMTGTVECSFSEAVNLLYLANDYEVNDLKKPLEEEILKMISEENCFDTFRVAKTLGIESVAKRCHLFFKSDPFKAVLTQPNVHLLSKEAFEDVLLITNFSSKRVKGDEFTLFSSVLEWSKKNAYSDEAEGYKRVANELILKYVNFKNFVPADIVKIMTLQIMNPMHIILIQNHCQDPNIDISSVVPPECAVLSTLKYEGRSMTAPKVEEESEGEVEPTISSKILNKEQIKELGKQLSGFENWKLLMRGSDDGFTPKVFHKKCDDVTPTICVARSVEGNIFGGFSPISWNCSNGKQVVEKRAWVFKFEGNRLIRVNACSDRNVYAGVYLQSSYGPCWGCDNGLWFSYPDMKTVDCSYMLPGGGSGYEREIYLSKQGAKSCKINEFEVFTK